MRIICENCSKEIADNKDLVISVKNGEGMNFFCRECNKLFGTCHMCQTNITICGFFDDPDPMPRFIMVARKMQQGNTTVVEQRQIPNPDRVKKFCIETECVCLINTDEQKLCCRHSDCTTCTNYCEKEQFNFVQNFSEQEAIEN